MIKLKEGKLRGHRHGIVHKRSCQQLASIVVDDLLKHCLSNSMGDAAMQLTLYNHGVDLASTVVNRYKAHNLCLASFFVYLDHADMRAKGEDACGRFPEDRCLQARLDASGQRVGEVCR